MLFSSFDLIFEGNLIKNTKNLCITFYLSDDELGKKLSIEHKRVRHESELAPPGKQDQVPNKVLDWKYLIQKLTIVKPKLITLDTILSVCKKSCA